MRAEAWVALKLAVRHHPLCDRFDTDRFGPVCSGCAMFWPAALIAWPVAIAAWLDGASAWALLFGATVLGLPQLLTLRWRFGRAMRAAIKLLGGIAVSTAVFAIAVLPAPWSLRGALFAAMGLSFAGLMALRARSILRTCDACVWKRDWGRCPGFGALDAGPHGNATLTWQEVQA